MVNAPDPSPPLDLMLKRKPPKTRHQLPPKKRKINIGKNGDIVDMPNAGSSTADNIEQPTVSETNITSPDASVAGPAIPLTPPLPPVSLPTDLEAAADENDLKTKIKSLKWNKRTQCSAIHCKNYQCNNSDVAFHRFPKEPDRCAKWVQNLRNASLMGMSSQRLNTNYRVCSAHFDASQFKRSCDVHAGLKWNAVPTVVSAPDPPAPLDLKLKRKRPKKCQELPSKKRTKSFIVDLPNAVSSTADSVEQPPDSKTSHDASVAGPSTPPTPLLPPVSLPPVSLPPVSLPPVSLPPVSLPSVSLPSVSLPPVSLPPVSLPPVSLPPVSLPPVSLPPVSLPPVSLPPVSLPPVSLPPVSLPPVSLPPVSLPTMSLPTMSLPTMSLPTDLEAAAAREKVLKKNIKNLRVQVCRMKAKIRNMNQLNKTRKASVNKETVMEELKKLLPAKTYAFMRTQIRVSQRKANGFRWTTQDKAFFLSLLHASPKCYRLLLDVFCMPSVRTLQKLMKSDDFKHGFNPNILATTKKATKSPRKRPMDKNSAKHCSQDSPRSIIEEHNYDKVTTDCIEDETDAVYADPPVTANAGTEVEQSVQYLVEMII
ncbi:uncharacterized protein [Paramisgurnus dabryanus]